MERSKIKNVVLISLTLLSAVNGLAQTAEITIQKNKYKLSQLCFDNGFIRHRIIPEIRKSVVETQKINLENGESFYRNDFISHQIRFYNRDSSKFEISEISQCEDEKILNFISSPTVQEVEPTAAEAVVYGNLLNNDINDIFLLDWKKYGTFENYLRYQGEDDRLSMSKDFSLKSQSIDWSNYDHWKEFSTIYRGGDRSGGGSDDITVRFNLDHESLKRMSKEKTGVNKLLGIRSIYDRVVKEGIKLPKSLMWIKDKSE